jgi:hypothetical protein
MAKLIFFILAVSHKKYIVMAKMKNNKLFVIKA